MDDAQELPGSPPVTPVIMSDVGAPLVSKSYDLASLDTWSCRLSKGSQDSTDARETAVTASSQSSAQQNGGYDSAAQQTNDKGSQQAAHGQLTRADVEDAYSLFQVRCQCSQRQKTNMERDAYSLFQVRVQFPVSERKDMERESLG